MDPIAAHATPYMALLVCSVVLLIVHVMLQGFFATRELGPKWNAGPRETYPAVVALILALAFYSDARGIGLIGGWVWFLARIAYIPLYLQGIPKVRSLIWMVSLLGIAMMVVGLMV